MENRMKRRNLYTMKDLLRREDGMGTVEIILIIVVLISLVLIFKTQLTSLVNTVFSKISSEANSI